MIGTQHRAVALSVDELMPVASINTKPVQPSESYGMVGVIVLVVAGLHIVLLTQVFSAHEFKLEIAPSAVISGVLITAPQQSEPQPKQAPKQTTPKATPMPKVRPKPVEISKPVIAPPPAPEIKAAQEVVPLEQMIDTPVYEPVPKPVPAETEVESTSTPPVVPPRSDAKHLNNPAPVYPRTALRLGQEGTVILNLLVRADGSVDEVKVKTSSGYARLDEAAVKAVRRWRYLAASQGGRSIDFWYEQPVVFSLRK